MSESRRVCRTVEEAWQAGWEDGKQDRPLSPKEINRLVVLHAPYLREPESGAEAEAS